MILYSRYNRPPSVSLSCVSASPVQQQFLEETKIDNILKKYSLQQTYINQKPLAFFDTSLIDDFQTTQNKMILAQSYFESLPSKIRQEVGNSLESFVEYLQKPQNRSRLIDLGVLKGSTRSDSLVDSGAREVASQPSEKSEKNPDLGGEVGTISNLT